MARAWERQGKNRQLACKPGSVWPRRQAPERGSHSSGTTFARRLSQPTRMTDPETGWNACALRVIPIRFCSRWGLPCRPCCQARGGLLPHPFTLTPQAGWYPFCGTFPGVAPAGRYPAPCFRGARTFLTLPPFGIGKARLPGQLAGRSLTEAAADCYRNNRLADHHRKCAAKSTRYASSLILFSHKSSAPSRPISSELLAAAPQPPVITAIRGEDV